MLCSYMYRYIGFPNFLTTYRLVENIFVVLRFWSFYWNLKAERVCFESLNGFLDPRPDAAYKLEDILTRNDE